MESVFSWTTYGSSLALILGYLILCWGSYCHLRPFYPWRPVCALLAILLTQAGLSFIFQVRFLTGSVLAEWLFLPLLFLGAGLGIRRSSSLWKKDGQELLRCYRSHLWVAVPLSLFLLYLFFQVWLLYPQNFDSLVYHLPRVELFIQENTFFLQSATRYHQLVFPVGADILFYPFLRMNNPYGLGIFSFTSYLCLGLGCYALGTYVSGSKPAGCLSGLAVMAMPLIVYQATSTKNDILLAAVFLGLILHILTFQKRARAVDWGILMLLLTYGVSLKPLFLAAIPGLFLFALVLLRLWRWNRLRTLLGRLWEARLAVLACLIPCLVLSQAWLFVWNAANHQGWSGPPEFVESLNNPAGFPGAIRNAMAYVFQTIHLGRVADLAIGFDENQRLLSENLSLWVRSLFDSWFGDVKTTRGKFQMIWVDHEDFSWFGPLGIFLLFIAVPVGVFLNRRLRVFLIPSLVYFAIVSYEVAWMPWNGRFFVPFFVGLSPALAVVTAGWLPRIKNGFLLVILFMWGSAIVLNVNKPLISLPPPKTVPQLWNPAGHNIWQSRAEGNPRYFYSKHYLKSLLENIPEGSSVGLMSAGHDEIYDLFYLRPDIDWIPLSILPEVGRVEFHLGVSYFLNSELDTMLLIGFRPKAEALPAVSSKRFGDTTLLKKGTLSQ